MHMVIVAHIQRQEFVNSVKNDNTVHYSVRVNREVEIVW